MSDKPIARLESDTAIYRASAAGSCLRALVAARLGYEPLPPAERFEVIFKEGHRHEEHIIEDLREQGYDVQQVGDDGRQLAIAVPVSQTILIEGHLDGLTEDFVVECKALSQDSFKKWLKDDFKAFPKYGVQIAIYMTATGKKALYAVKNRNTGQLDVRILDDPPASVADIKRHIIEAEAYARRGELPDCDKDDFFCPFRYLHDSSPTEEAEIDEAIEALAATYARARERETEAKAAKNEAKKRLEDQLGDREKVESSNYKVSRSQTTRRKLDTDKMAAELGDETIERYTVTNTYPTLRVMRKGDRDGQPGQPE